MEFVCRDAQTARAAGRYQDALEILTRQFVQIDNGELKFNSNHFITMFEWEMLAEEYPPALEEMARVRDEQIGLLRDGKQFFGSGTHDRPQSRFQVIVGMNNLLKDQRSTYELFVQLIALFPDVARREAFLALPAILEAGDFSLAEGYIEDPLKRLDELNGNARDLPLFPPGRQAPRLGAELSNFMREVTWQLAVHRGQGRDAQADVLHNAVLNGIESDELRELSARELASPGTIMREITAHHMGTVDG